MSEVLGGGFIGFIRKLIQINPDTWIGNIIENAHKLDYLVIGLYLGTRVFIIAQPMR